MSLDRHKLQSTMVNLSRIKFVRIIRYDELKVQFNIDVIGVCLVRQTSFARINRGVELTW